jgi:DNA excision repair protein ERCC-2
MAIRYDDAGKRILLSVRDLVEDGRGSAGLAVAQSLRARAAAGRAVHTDWQLEQSEQDAGYRSEVSLRRPLPFDDWTVELFGRVDGMTTVGDHTVVEEVKSTTLDARRLHATTLDDWPGWVDQLRVYLWMLAESGHAAPVGRLVVVSVYDGSRQVLGVAHDHATIGARIRQRAEDLVRDRRARVAWMERRRVRAVPDPFASWRPGQREIVEAVHWGLDAGNAVLVEAPTGLGKTGAALAGVLRHALPTDRQLLFATARTTQQAGAVRSLATFAGRGLPLRSLVLRAKDKVCLREVVDCRPEVCPFAAELDDKRRAADLPAALLASDVHVDAAAIEAAARRAVVCPHALALDAAAHVDVLVGDYNYALEPGVRLEGLLGGEGAKGFVLVIDEVHQLADRARGWYSPRLSLEAARNAIQSLWLRGAAFAPWVGLAQRVEAAVLRLLAQPSARALESEKVVAPPLEPFRALAAEIDALAVDYAHRAAEVSALSAEGVDPWMELAWRTLSFADALEEEAVAPERVPLATTAPGSEAVTLLCLDPGPRLGAALAAFGGVVGLSATLSPPEYHRQLLGLPEDRTDVVRVPSSFPPEHRRVLVAPRISTAFKDRADHAEATAKLLVAATAATPGNVAVYFPSFQMLDDLAARCVFGREVVRQHPGMDDALREAALARLRPGGPPTVLLAVLGGVFAEGIDLPSGSLSTVIVVSPALPPVGLERELLREQFEARFGRGFLYASLVPGLTRVVQAAGRLHRRPEDRGVIVLVDRRFRWREVLELLPGDWQPSIELDPVPAIRSFFEEPGG